MSMKKILLSILIYGCFTLPIEAQILGYSECFSEGEAFIGLDRKGWTSDVNEVSESYQFDFMLPEEPPFDCYELEYVDISISLSVNENNIIPECFLGFWTHVLECIDHDPIGCPTSGLFFDMQGLNTDITLTQDLEDGIPIGVDVVVLTVHTNPICNQTPISLAEFEADVEVCLEAYYVPKEIDEEIDLGDDIIVCPGELVDLEGPDGYEEYVWDGPIDSDEQTLEDAIPGDYILEVYDAEGCRLTDDISITEQDEFQISLSENLPLSLCEGQELLLEAVIESIQGNPDYDYEWMQGQSILSQNSSININMSGDYNLIVTDQLTDCSQTFGFNIGSGVVSSAQIDSISLDTLILCDSDTANLIAFVPFIDMTNYSFEWISPTDTLIADSISVFTSGNYILNQYNELGCPSTSDTIFVQVNSFEFAGNDNSTSLCTGIQYNLSNLLSSEAALSGVWQSEDFQQNINGNFLSTGTLSEGSYDLIYIVSNTAPCPNDTSVHSITLIDGGLSAGDDASSELCPGESIDLSTLLTTSDLGEFYDGNLQILSTGLVDGMQIGTGENKYYYIVENQECDNDTAEFIITLLEDADPFLITGPICDTESIMVNGSTYNLSSSTGSEVLVASNGCDSIINIDLQFFPAAESSIDSELCSGESIDIQGEIFDESNPSGSVLISGASSQGCDSLVNISLSFVQTLTSEINNELCEGESITVNGIVYDETNPSGTENLISTNGCDSIVTVMLNYLENSEASLSFELCPGASLDINGELLNESNSRIIQTLTNSVGCDSLLSVQAVILSNSEFTFEQDICQGESVTLGGEVFDESNPSGIVVLEDSAQNSCDSIIHVSLTVFPVSEQDFDYEICEGDSININGSWYSTAGTFTDNLQDANGCDSIVNNTITLIDCAVSITVDVLSGLDCFEGEGSEISIMFNNNAIGLFYRVFNEAGQIVANGPIVINNVNIEDLAAGTFEIRIEDNGQTLASEFFEITQPDAITVNTILVQNLECFGESNGNISLDMSGGTPPLSILWNEGSNTSDLSSLEPGTYSYTITDSKQCTNEGFVEISTPGMIELAFSQTDASCPEVDNGSLSITSSSGGTGSLQYSLDGTSFSGNNIFENLSPGDYTLFVQDENMCQESYDFSIGLDAALIIEAESPITIDAATAFPINLNLNFTAESVSWSNPELLSCDNCTNPLITAEVSTSLSVTAFDENGCSVSATIEVIVIEMLNNEMYIPNIIQLNSTSPEDNVFKPLLGQDTDILIRSMRIFDRWGNMVFEENGPNITGWTGYLNDRKLEQGVYLYQLEYLEGSEEKLMLGQVTLIR